MEQMHSQERRNVTALQKTIAKQSPKLPYSSTFRVVKKTIRSLPRWHIANVCKILRSTPGSVQIFEQTENILVFSKCITYVFS